VTAGKSGPPAGHRAPARARSTAPGLEEAARQRLLRGVYATPPELTGYLVRSVDLLLRTKLGRARGLADPGVLLLDPAAGPANFLAAAWQLAAEHHRQAGGDVAELLRDHLLPHFVGCELLASSHAEGLAVLEDLAAALDPQGEEISPLLLLADALDPPPALLDLPFNVVLGNPPWRGHSANQGAWIEGLLHGYERPDGTWDEGYFRIDGRPLGERNSKWLHDDYVKFLRLAQWRIDQTGEGIAAFVVNHNCLEAPTFRGLRRSLLGTFDEIHVLDLHGNRRRRERAPDGRADENVFTGVAQGAALLILVKLPDLPRRVLHAER
jgi:predicted helicase